MIGGEAIFLFTIMATVVLLDLLACEGWFVPRLWDWIKERILAMVAGFRLLLGLDHVNDTPARDPDWAAAADEVGLFDPLPEPVWNAIALWTPAEREAFELDETASFIESTDRTLDAHAAAVREANAIRSWEEWSRRMNLSEERIRAARERDQIALAAQKAHAERVARRNGANLLPDDEDDLAALQVLNRTRPSRERRREERLG